jgi:RNA polymerase sigma-70 factor (ECF subfamily)
MLAEQLSTWDDEQLMTSLCASTNRETSNAVFAEVFARYEQRVISWCYRVTRDRESATDLAQEVFLKAFRHCRSFRGDSRLSTWLFSIARNHCLTAIRRRHDEVVPLETANGKVLAEASCSRSAWEDDRLELCNSLLRLMNRTLEPLEVRVLTLHYAHEVPLAVITRQLALTNPSGAKAYIVNARRKLNRIASRRGWDHALIADPPVWRSRAAA